MALDTPPQQKDGGAPGGGGEPPRRPPVAIYSTRRRRRRWGWKRIVLTTVAVVLAILLALGAAVAWWAYGVYGQVTHASADVRAASGALSKGPPLPNQPKVALIIGSDHRKTDGASPARSDTLMLVRIDPKTHLVTMLSLPRDLHADIPGYGIDKINAAYSLGGAKLAVETVHRLTGLPINYLITVDFHGFVDLVNAFGGVYLNVDQFYFHSNADSYEKYSQIDVKPGYQLLDGRNALAFARYRHTDSDFYRVARQQLFLQAFDSRVSGRLKGISLSDIPTIRDAIETIARNVEVTGATGAPGIRTIINYARLAYEIRGHVASVHLQATDAGDSTDSYVAATPAAIHHAVYQFTHPRTLAPPTASLPKRRTHHHHAARFKPAVDPTSVSLTVVNGNGVTGDAGKAGDALSRFGYQVTVSTTPAPTFSYHRTEVYFRPGSKAAAGDLVQILGGARAAPMPSDFTQATDVVVVVGAAFKGTTAIAPPRQRNENALPPDIQPDDQVYRAQFAAAHARVHFPVVYPTVTQTASVFQPFTSQQPIRTYRIGAAGGNGPNSLYAIFHIADIAGAYWGVEETRFVDAPILKNPNAVRKLGGRRYEFFFNGSHIHLIAFVQDGIAYWVTNTLLDDLSNRDMVAIARSLEPLA